LRDQGVDLIQGYLLGKPVPCGELDLAGVPHSELREVSCA
jgi:EAL domain-containing protein (putative c-di-GMP-specific phosphodiesterase class I)